MEGAVGGEGPSTRSRKAGRPRSSSRGKETSRETSRPLETSRETSRPLETSRETSRPLETSRETSHPLETSRETSRPLETSRETSRPLKTRRETSRPYAAEDDNSEGEEDHWEDASDAGEIFLRAPPLRLPSPTRKPAFIKRTPPTVSNPSIEIEHFDGSGNWEEYLVYYNQLTEIYDWDDCEKARYLGVSLKGEARVVITGLSRTQRASYSELCDALTQSFAPKELVHVHQAELKARKKKPTESMADLGRALKKLVRLAYPSTDSETRETLALHAFLDALPGPVSELKMHVIKGRPRNLQEAVAHATEVDSLLEIDKATRKRGDLRMVGIEGEGDSSQELTKLGEELKKALAKIKDLESKGGASGSGSGSGGNVGKQGYKRRPLSELICYECHEKGHIRSGCPKLAKQGNEPRRLDSQ